MTDLEVYVIEHITSSGFKLEITPLSPYYMDIIGDVYPYMEYPKREIKLLAGDVVLQDYEPSEEMPTEDDDDYPLWLRWHEVDSYNKGIDDTRKRVRRDLLLSLCVTIIEGSIDIDDPEWIMRIESPFNGAYKVPKDVGQRRLVFLKYVVLSHQDDADEIMQLAMFKEVTYQGIGNALDGFQYNMGWSTDNRNNRDREEKSIKA